MINSISNSRLKKNNLEHIDQLETSFLPKISIIIPTLNEESNIENCLKSIFQQDYPKQFIEVIVVDGNSTDNTVVIAKKYAAKVLYNSKATTGISRNIGIQASLGEIICFIDADNELPHSKWLKKMVLPLLANSKIAGTLPFIIVKKTHPPASRLYALMQANPLVSLMLPTGRTIKSNLITASNYLPIGGNGILIRKSAILDAGNFKAIRGQEDVDLTFRIVNRGRNFLMVSEGIYHLSHRTFHQIHKKMYVRISDYIKNYSNLSYKFIPSNKSTKYSIDTISRLILPFSFMRVIKGLKEDQDIAWLYYPIIFYFTIGLFGLLLCSNRTGIGIIKNLILK